MARQEDIYPECNVDTNLMGFIIGCGVKHKRCCNEVAKALNAADGFAIGVVDDDKRSATFDSSFVIYSSTASYKKKHITFYPNQNGKKFVFKIHKAMDEFIFDAAKEMGVDLSELGYPRNLDDFKEVTKLEDAAKNPKLRRLFVQISDYPELKAFRNTIKYLINMKLEADIDVAKRFFDGDLGETDLIQILNDQM